VGSGQHAALPNAHCFRDTFSVMMFRDSLTRRNKIIAAAVLGVGLIVGGFILLRRAPRVDMVRYVPASALAFVEIDSLADLADGLTNTNAWRELGPALSLSSQLRQMGFFADLMGRTGLGPDEAVLVGRAQYAIAVTGVEAQSGENEEGPYLHLKPDFALIIESHLKPQAATRLVQDRALLIAQKIYGESVAEETDDYGGSHLLIFHGTESSRRLIASSFGSVIVLANQDAAMKSCLDAIAGRAASLAEDSTLKEMRSIVDHDSTVVGYVTASGVRKLFEIWPALIAGGSAEPGTVSSFTDLLQHVSEQAAEGLLYSLQFADGGVTEKYLTVLRPQVAQALAETLKPASEARLQVLAQIPQSIERLTLVEIQSVGDSPERVLKHLSPNLDLVAGVALREFVISLRKEYGLEAGDSLGDAAADEIAFVNFGDGGPSAMLIPANQKARLQQAAEKYLKQKGSALTRETTDGIEIMISSHDDRRAAAFIGDCLVVATRDQILKIGETNSSGMGIDRDKRLMGVLSKRPAGTSVISYRPQVQDAGPFLLAISKLTRVTDGSRELLERDSIRHAMERLPRSASYTQFRDYGVYVESKSAVGSFTLLNSLVKPDDE
jgi:hypothetical protein